MHQIEISKPCLLSDHLRDQRIPLKMSCGGHGSCKTCRVMLDGQPVLACQTQVEPQTYDLTVPPSAASSGEILIDLESLEDGLVARQPRWKIVEVTVPGAEDQPGISNRLRLEASLPEGITPAPDFFTGLDSNSVEGNMHLACFDSEARFRISDKKRTAYAIAVDVGTTTLAAALIDLAECRILASRGRLNGQYAYAEDLVARISFCHTRELLEEMQELGLRRTLLPLIRGLLKDAGVSANDVLTTILSGNAPMIHILLGMDPSGMGGWPFNGVDFCPTARPAKSLRLPGHQLEIIPAKSAYLGGDIVSGLAHLDFANAPDQTLFVDLGTNAEMALKAGDKLFCTAVPAGPSFEGGGMPCGVSAIPGAIDQVWEADGQLEYSTIGNKPPIGLCGSGIISFVAAAFRARILRKKGRFARRHDRVETRELLGQDQRVFAFTEDIYVSEDDISNFLQAKAAVFAGIITLCKIAQVDVFSLTKLLLAGNFGRRVRARDMIDIGIIPPIGRDHIETCGNTSLKGAIHSCLDEQCHDRITTVLSSLEFIELNAQDSFQNDFINALFIPHLTMEFPKEPAQAG